MLRRFLVAFTFAAIAAQVVPWIPRDVLDYSSTPLLQRIHQPQKFGSDTVADEYEARVVLTDVRDMYTKRHTEQTALEAGYWSRAASAPYPPAMLLTEAALYSLTRTLRGFYLTILGLAAIFLVLSALYCLRTTWYVFPLLYLNFQFLGERFAAAQDCSYLVMLVVVMLALFAARAGRPAAHLLMALATTMKLSPLFYVTEVRRMPLRWAVPFLGILFAGLVLPYFVWENYLYIYAYGAGLKGSQSNHLWAAIAAPAFASAVLYVAHRRGFDMEDRVGWALIPMAVYFAVYTNGSRHLVMALLVPDKRVWRNLPVPIALTLHTLFPGVVKLGSVLTIAIALLGVILAGYAFAPAPEEPV